MSERGGAGNLATRPVRECVSLQIHSGVPGRGRGRGWGGQRACVSDASHVVLRVVGHASSGVSMGSLPSHSPGTQPTPGMRIGIWPWRLPAADGLVSGGSRWPQITGQESGGDLKGGWRRAPLYPAEVLCGRESGREEREAGRVRQPSHMMLLGRTEQEPRAQSCRRPVLLIKRMRELGFGGGSLLPKRQMQDWNRGLLAPEHVPVSTLGLP